MRIHARTVQERETTTPARSVTRLYDFGVPSPANWPIPLDIIPALCRERQCSLRITDPKGHCATELEHEDGNGVSEYHVSAEQLDAMYYDLWADIRRWIDGLHEGEGGR